MAKGEDVVEGGDVVAEAADVVAGPAAAKMYPLMEFANIVVPTSLIVVCTHDPLVGKSDAVGPQPVGVMVPAVRMDRH